MPAVAMFDGYNIASVVSVHLPMRFPSAAERTPAKRNTVPMRHFLRFIGLFAKPLVEADVGELARCSAVRVELA
jgi:hypothetical protein